MSTDKMTAAKFLADVANHQIKVFRDEGTYRHLHFKSSGENHWNQWFEIVTWPGVLTIHGDMGSWAFARVPDMFTFFRQPEFRINAPYWQEKIVCESIVGESKFSGPSRQFDRELFKANVLASLDGYTLTDRQKNKIVKQLKADVFPYDDNEHDLRRELVDFRCDDFQFVDVREISGKAYSYHFLWCLHAIVWGIERYDAARANG